MAARHEMPGPPPEYVFGYPLRANASFCLVLSRYVSRRAALLKRPHSVGIDPAMK
jgi:hypothetical protein